MNPSRSRTLGMALLGAVFAAGALAGAAFEHVAEARPAARAREARCEGERGGRGKRLVEQVDPTPAQMARIDSIMERRRRQMDAFWDGEGQRLRAIVDSARAEVRQVLTPEQRAEYDRLVAEKHARRGKHKGGAGTPPTQAEKK